MAAYTITIRSTKGSALSHSEGDANFTAVSDIITALGLTDADSTITFPAKVLADNMFITEAAAATTDVAGQGQLWVISETPNRLVFTDDAGTDFYPLSLDAVSDGHVVLPLTNDAVTPTLGYGDGGDGIYSSADGTLNYSLNGVSEWAMSATSLTHDADAAGPALMGEAATATNPTVVHNKADATSGMGGVSGELSLITGGTEAMNIDSSQEITGIKLKKYSETVATNATATGAVSLNLDNGPFHDVTLTGNVTFTFTNPVATGRLSSFTLKVAQDGTGSRTITWPASVDWDAGTAPTLTTTASAISILTFLTHDGGTIWYGFLASDDAS